MYKIVLTLVRARRYLVTVDEIITKRVALHHRREQEAIVRVLYQQVDHARRLAP